MRAKILSVQYHRMPKYIGRFRTTAPSYIRIFWRGRFVLDIPVPKYGTERWYVDAKTDEISVWK